MSKSAPNKLDLLQQIAVRDWIVAVDKTELAALTLKEATSKAQKDLGFHLSAQQLCSIARKCQLTLTCSITRQDRSDRQTESTLAARCDYLGLFAFIAKMLRKWWRNQQAIVTHLNLLSTHINVPPLVLPAPLTETEVKAIDEIVARKRPKNQTVSAQPGEAAENKPPLALPAPSPSTNGQS